MGNEHQPHPELAPQLRQQEQIKGFRGKLEWQGDLDAMRRDQ